MRIRGQTAHWWWEHDRRGEWGRVEGKMGELGVGRGGQGERRGLGVGGGGSRTEDPVNGRFGSSLVKVTWH